MRQAEYLLVTHNVTDIQTAERFVGERWQARIKCREIDKGTFGQATHIQFVKYVE